MLVRLRRRVWGLSGRLIASYILVTLVVVVLVEAVVLGFQVPSLVNSGQLQAQVDAAAQSPLLDTVRIDHAAESATHRASSTR